MYHMCFNVAYLGCSRQWISCTHMSSSRMIGVMSSTIVYLSTVGFFHPHSRCQTHCLLCLDKQLAIRGRQLVIMVTDTKCVTNFVGISSGVSSMELRELKHPTLSPRQLGTYWWTSRLYSYSYYLISWLLISSSLVARSDSHNRLTGLNFATWTASKMESVSQSGLHQPPCTTKVKRWHA